MQLRALVRPPLAALILLAIGGHACAPALTPPASVRTLSPTTVLELAGQFSIAPFTRFPPEFGPFFGGLSGLAPTGQPGEFFAVSDDRTDHRLYRIRVAGEDGSFRVEILDTIRMEPGSGAPRLDPEAIVVTRTGDLIVASEGRATPDGRAPPAIAMYSRRGGFMRLLPLRERFVPNQQGQPPRGVRENAGFESLTLSPSGQRLYSATETALHQDGDPVTFERGTTARILEYAAERGTFIPTREYAYPLEPLDPPPFTAGTIAAGVVELLAVSDDELLALERVYIEIATGPVGVEGGTGINRIHLYHVSLKGAQDVSAIDSLRAAGSVIPVRKTLLLDLSSASGLAPGLTTLDNFEGLAEGPVLADGSRSLLLVSDDNFNRAQRTWFVQLRLGRQVSR